MNVKKVTKIKMWTHFLSVILLTVLTNSEVLVDDRNQLFDDKNQLFDNINPPNELSIDSDDDEEATTPMIYDDSQYEDLGSPMFTDTPARRRNNTNKYVG